MWADRYGGRNMMIVLLVFAAIPTYLFSRATTYNELLIFVAYRRSGGQIHSAHRRRVELGLVSQGNEGGGVLEFLGRETLRTGAKALVFFTPAVLTIIPASGYFGGVLPGELLARYRHCTLSFWYAWPR